MSVRSVSGIHSATWPTMLTWVTQFCGSIALNATRGSRRRCSIRFRPSSMFTTIWPSSKRYHVGYEIGCPSGRTTLIVA